MRNRAQIVVAVVLMALGVLWSGQGVGWIGGSFMTCDRTWLFIGIALLAVGLVLLVRALRGGLS